MPKIVKPLSDLQVRRIRQVGWHAVGGVPGLLLQVREPAVQGAQTPRSWVLRLTVCGARKVIGLGSYPLISLALAREQATQLTIEVKRGGDPLESKRQQLKKSKLDAAKKKTFKECAVAFMEAHRTSFTSEKHAKQWDSTLETYAYPHIGHMLVSEIAMPDIRNVLEQQTVTRQNVTGKLWYVKNETAKRLMDRMKSIFDYAIVNEFRTGVNPAQWSGYLSTQLPAPNKLRKKEHYIAVPYEKIHEFMVHLRTFEGMSAKALEFLILTSVRSGSVRNAEWSEINFEKGLWVIPASHTKTRQEHRVPLAPQAMRLLASLAKRADTNIIFPSRNGKALSDMALSRLMIDMFSRRQLEVKAVPHGFRSTFRDWSADQTSYPDEIRKAASGHNVGDAVKDAYQRTDLLDKRRNLMNDWANFLDHPSLLHPVNIVSLNQSA